MNRLVFIVAFIVAGCSKESGKNEAVPAPPLPANHVAIQIPECGEFNLTTRRGDSVVVTRCDSEFKTAPTDLYGCEFVSSQNRAGDPIDLVRCPGSDTSTRYTSYNQYGNAFIEEIMMIDDKKWAGTHRQFPH